MRRAVAFALLAGVLTACAQAPSVPPVMAEGPLRVSMPAARFVIGQPATFTVNYAGLPPGAGLELALQPVDPQSGEEIGPTGPLMARHVPLSAAGVGELKWTWPGKAVYQAPADAPIPVDIKPGRYRITATAVDKVTCTICFRIPIKTLAEWSSGPVEIVAR